MGGTLYVTPQSGVYQVGQPFEVQVLADTGGQAVNAVEGELAYNPSDFAIDNISIDHSILTTWSTTPAYDGATGTISFSGWASQTYAGKNGLLITVTLRPLRVAQSVLSFNSGAMLAADGHGTNIIITMTSGNYSLSPQQVTPPAPAPVATSTAATPITQTQSAPSSAAPQTVSVAPQSQVASLVSSGVSLAPFVGGFFAALVLIAFGIAYVLHRKGTR